MRYFGCLMDSLESKEFVCLHIVTEQAEAVGALAWYAEVRCLAVGKLDFQRLMGPIEVVMRNAAIRCRRTIWRIMLHSSQDARRFLRGSLYFYTILIIG